MSYDEAIDAMVTRDEAIRECAAHGIVADWDIDTAELFDCTSGETIAMPNRYGEYAGADVLAWLGY